MGLVAWLELGARAVAVSLAILATTVAVTHWAVRRRYLTPFSWWSRTVRQLSDPVLRPLEGRLVRSGQNPQDAPLWLVGVAVATGLFLLGTIRWFVGMAYSVVVIGQAPPLVALRIIFSWAVGLVMTALLVRVIATWIGVSPASKLMRLLALLTDWIVNPIRRRLPAGGRLDLSPAIAYLVLLLLRSLLAV